MSATPLASILRTLPQTVLAALMVTSTLSAHAAAVQTHANRPAEIVLEAAGDRADPFNTLSVDAVFTDPAGKLLRVPAFWAGGRTWKIRYASGQVGVHRFRTECSDAADAGLHGVAGQIEVTAYGGDNPLFRRGPIRVAADRRHLAYADGTPFFWLGDTWWMGLCHRLHWPDEFAALAADRKQKGFSVIQIVAGLYPDMPAFDPRGANEAGFPWEKDYARIRPEYFDLVDRRLEHLVDQGLSPCVVGAWGYFMPWMGQEKIKQHWRYLIARYGAMPVTWCAAGEANLPWYLVKDFPYDDRQQVHGWTEVLRYIRQTDPFRRPLTIHPTAIRRYTARHATDEPSLLDFDMLQTPHGQEDGAVVAVQATRESYAATPQMPVLDGEASYEMLSDSLPTRWTRAMFWLCMTNGAAGHTYGANGIWQCNRKDQPHGKSPHGGTYGKITWDEAMRLPGSTHLALGKRLFEQYPWPQFKPHSEWVAYSGGRTWVSFEGCRWLWYPEGNPAHDAPIAKRYFRRAFTLPDKKIAEALVRIAVDDRGSLRLNGHAVGDIAGFRPGSQFPVAKWLKPGANLLCVAVENCAANVPNNPGGWLARLEVTFVDGTKASLVSDDSWRASRTAPAGWDAADFDDAAWPKALASGRYGDAPWGPIDTPDGDRLAPQAAGIPGVVRIIYVPEDRPIAVRNLGANAAFRATYFDPLTGRRTPIANPRADAAGTWNCPPPAQRTDPDWVLIIEPPQPAVASPDVSTRVTLANEQIAWHLDFGGGALRTVAIENRRSGGRLTVSAAREVAVAFSAAADRVQLPLTRLDEFAVRQVRRIGPATVAVSLVPRAAAPALDVTVYYALDGPTRRKWIELANRSDRDVLLLDVELDDLATDGSSQGGGQGEPVFVEGEYFAAVEHPSGMNQQDRGRVRLGHHPGRRLRPGETLRSRVALWNAVPRDAALPHFLDYVQSHALRKPRTLAVYTPFGINNQWGACPALDDEQTLDVLGLLAKWQRQGVRFDYFTLDTGWIDPGADLTQFRPVAYPEGPGRVLQRIRSLGMQPGLWFATSWAAESCWDYPPALAGQPPIDMTYRLGYPDKPRVGQMYCFAAEPYYQTLRKAVLHHVRHNGARFLKFDGGSYGCDRTDHGHLPGRYSVEAMHDRLIALSEESRALAPDTFIMWYWGLRSPFWALHGHTIFESGLSMEGSGTSAFPALYYRDSVTLAQDQNAQHARLIPPLAKDSLGVWLADTRWGNFMGRSRWREAMVMDLGRGNMLFPNLWGNLYHLGDDDVAFLARLQSVARRHEPLLAHRRNILGDPMANEVYGYAYGVGQRGLLFVNNAHFAARRAEITLDNSLGLSAAPGTPLGVRSQFPAVERLARCDGSDPRLGDSLEIWLRPFETLLLEVSPATSGEADLPLRKVTARKAQSLGIPLALSSTPCDPSLAVRFSDAAQFEARKMSLRGKQFRARLPAVGDEPAVLALVLRLRQGTQEWRYSPVVAEIAQARARVAGHSLQLVPVPDGRQYGNTQKAGCSWCVYQTRLSRSSAGQPLDVSVYAHLPEGVDVEVEAWVVGRWWQESARPTGDGYYADAPS